jgi:surfactin family lipopeptide synthetase A
MLGTLLQLIESHSIERPSLKRLRYLILTGEALPAALARRWFEHYPNIPLVNAYGPTECSDDVTHHIMTEPPDGSQSMVPIGKPIINTQIYVLDDKLEPVPIGVPGELYVAGRCVGMGYINDPGKTEAAFLPNPFAPGTDELIYRTGDRGYWTENGELIYLGRIDHQVKVHGFRIELGEIEAVLDRMPEVRQSVVLLVETEPGEPSLAAYLCTEKHHELSPSVVREALKERLPHYMVPSHVVMMEQFPLTPNGKIDRKALPIPDMTNVKTLPETEEERAIAAIWSELLGISPIGTDDNFFDLGGNSLLATQIVYRMRAEFEMDDKLTLREFFRDATIAKLAGYVRKTVGPSDRAAASKATESIPRYPERELVELSHAQKRFWFHMQYSSNEALGMVWAFELEGPLQAELLMDAFRQTALRHDMMRSVVVEMDGMPFLKTGNAWMPHIPYHDLSAVPIDERDSQVDAYITAEKARPFALTGEPFFRIALFKLNAIRHILIVNAHHIGADAWSHQVVMDDVSAFYDAALRGEEATLSPVFMYRDFIQWQNSRLEDGQLDDQRDYWKRRLAEDIVPPRLGQDELTASEKAAAEANPSLERTLSEPLAAQLRKLASRTGGSMFTVVLAGINIWLSKRSGMQTVTIGSTMFGRMHPDLERVCGLFINPVVLRTDLSGNPSGYDVIESVTSGAYEAFANQEYTYDLVVRDVRARTGSDRSLFTVVFIGQNNASHGWKLDGLTTRTYAPALNGATSRDELDDHSKVKDDLLISMYESERSVTLQVHYNGYKFYPSTVDGYLAEIEHVLAQLSEEPASKLARIALGTAESTEDWDEIFA